MVDDRTLGVVFVLGAWASYGSFGVPIKAPSVVSSNVSPLVFQFYKTFAVFLSSFLVLSYTQWAFTWWGFVGALIWVPSGVTAVAAVRLAGLAVSQGLWSAISVLVSFAWGALVFREHVSSWPLALLAVALIVAGTVGMARAAAPRGTPQEEAPLADPVSAHPVADLEGGSRTSAAVSPAGSDEGTTLLSERKQRRSLAGAVAPSSSESPGAAAAAALVAAPKGGGLAGVPHKARRPLGLALAVFTGAFGGSMYVPLHYAGDAAKGIQYNVSFSIGSMCVCSLLVLAHAAWSARGVPGRLLVPADFQWRTAALPGLLSGLLWACGNACGIYATLYLGQAVGATAIQCNLLVAGVWSALYYGEMRGQRFAWWAVSASLCLGGVAILVVYG